MSGSGPSKGYVTVIAGCIAGIGLCALVEGVVLQWRSHLPLTGTDLSLMIEFGLMAAGLGCVVAGVALHASHKRGQALLRAERALRQNASLDPLTRVLNRSSFLEAHGEAVSAARRGEPVALFLLDVDRLKEANDTHGHAMGDAMLRHIGNVLRWELEGAVIGRLGGDEFAFLLQGLGSKTVCERIANRLLAAVRMPARVNSVIVQMNASIGVAWTPDHTLDADELMRFADLALYAAKGSGRGRVKCFDRELIVGLQRRQMIERELSRALAAGQQLEVHYQPIIGEGGREIHGVEALLRWTHPEHGPIPPSEFIPIAEEVGLIDKLGQFVFAHAFRDLREWPELTLNINVSPAQLRTRNFSATVHENLAASGFKAERLCLEITEGVLLESGESQLAQIAELRSIGARISLDDFGAGYSSLAYVRDFPLDQIKIDRSYIMSLPSDPRSGVVVGAICQLGRGLDLSIIAEGVETEEHLALVRAAGCSNFQGYYFARPMSAARFAEFRSGWSKRLPSRAA